MNNSGFIKSWMAASMMAVTVFAAGLVNAADQPSRDAFDRLPAVEVPGRQIGWQNKGALEAFVKAVEETKPMVVVFGSAESIFTQRLAEFVMPCPHVNQLSGAAVFVYGPPEQDEYARRMALHLKLTHFPTISIIAPRTDKLTELYRIEGFFDAETIAADLRRNIEKAGLWPKDMPAPAALPPHVWAYPGKACTREGVQLLQQFGR